MKNRILEVGSEIFLNLSSRSQEFLISIRHLTDQDQKYQRYPTSKNLNLKVLLIRLFAYSLILAFIAPFAHASNFTSSYLRLDSQSANTALSGTVCAKASTAGAGTESKILVTFPSDFTISSTASNWTTSTTNLPAGSTAWPSIGASATSVSGKTVTFASADLLTTNLYCFNFTATSSTTGSSGNDKEGSITTKNSSNTTIDSSSYAVSIVSSSQINITASVDPQVSDLPITIESTTTGTTFPQNSTINYKITYGNSATTSIPLTIQAEWTQGTISGNPSPSVDILDYAVGSASNAYGSTPPVIDTVNRTITWTISSIPASTTGQTVTFSLKTNSSYTGSSLVSFSVLARATSGSTTTPDATVTRNYQYAAASVTATPTSSPSTTTPTPTPTTIPSVLAFKDISIRAITFDNAKIAVSTNNKATFTVDYGTSINSLSKTVKTLTYETNSVISFSDLIPETDYYFKIIASDENGKIITSDIFIFKTAIVSPIPTVDTQNITVISNNNILISPQIKAGNNLKTNIVVIPRQSVFTIQFTLNKEANLKSIQAILRNKRVLAFSTLDELSASSNYVNLVEISPGIYTGKIATPENAGEYEVYVRLIDFNGNILEQKILDLNVTNKFKVLVKGTKDTPVENARVLLYLYNQETKTYSVISPQIIPIENPVYSAPDGRYNIVLPYGRYKADVSAIGYNPQTVEFEINPYGGGYPVVYLEKNFSITNTIEYYFDTLKDAVNESQIYIKQRAYSNRLFDLSIFWAIFVFMIISILSVSARTHIGVFYLPYFLMFKLMILFKKNAGRIIFGKVLEEETEIPISRCIISLITTDGTQTVTTLKTNKLGEFYFNNPQSQDFKIKIEKEGFEASAPYDFKNSEVKEIPIVFKLKNKDVTQRSLFEVAFIYTEDFLGMAMESLILFGLLTLIYFIYTFGFLRVAPFLIITILNLILIFAYLYKPKGLEKSN